MSEPLRARNWFGKVSAAFVAGFAIALGISGLIYHAIGVDGGLFSLKGQFTMWIIAPIWSLILSFCFLFRNGARAWSWLGLCAAAIWLLLWMIGALS